MGFPISLTTLSFFLAVIFDQKLFSSRKRQPYLSPLEEYNVEKRERGSNIIPIIFMLLGRILSGVENGIFREEYQGLKIKIIRWGRISISLLY